MKRSRDGSEANAGVLRAESFTLARTEGQLYLGSQRVALGKQAMAVLQALLDAPTRAMPRNELMLRAWPGRCVEEANLSVQIGALRKALGRDAIVTSYGRGYRLTIRIDEVGADRRRSGSGGPAPLRGNLGEQHEPATSFVGRAQALATLSIALSSTQLLTLVGAGGIGKTRLALRLASSLTAEQFVFFVDAAPLHGMQQLDDALSMAFERRSSTAATWRETLPRSLGRRDACLVLDNCEHVATHCAELVKELIALCPTMKIVATSRVRLFVPGEAVHELPPLTVPALHDTGAASSSEATDLFLARADAAGHPLTASDFADVARICRSVDGVPLAIELAAAWLPWLAVREIADRLQRDLRLLDAAPAPPSRHHTMEATIRWSYSMLESEEQDLFRKLSVFAAGCTVEAALAVGGDGLDEYRALRCIARLQELSLLLRKGRRLSMLEPIRQFAAAELAATAEESELQRRHVDFYQSLAERHRTSDRAAHLAVLEPDLENLRAAQRYSLRSSDPRSRLEMVIALFEFLADTGRSVEAASFAADALAGADACDDYALRSAVHTAASRYAKEMRKLDAALHHAEQALAMARKADDTRRAINALDALAWAQFEGGDPTRGIATAIEARQMAHGAQLPLQIYMTENSIGELHRLTGNFAEAAVAFERAIDMVREQRDPTSLSMMLLNVALLLIAQQDFGRLPPVLLESATLSEQCGAHRTLPYLCRAAAAMSAHMDDHEGAAMLLGAASGQMQAMGLPLSAEDRQLQEAIEGELACAADSDSVGRAMSDGALLGRDAVWVALMACLQSTAGSSPSAQMTGDL